MTAWDAALAWSATRGVGFWLAIAAGLVLGHLLDRGVRRLAFCQSLLWPIWDYCPACLRPTPTRQAVPLLGPMLCLGRCPHCRSRVAWRPVTLALLTAGLLAGLQQLYFAKGAAWIFPGSSLYYDEPRLRALFLYHALLFSFLILASFIDLDLMIIPDSVTVPGMLVGVLLGTFWYVEVHPVTLWRPPTATPVLIAPALMKTWCAGWLDEATMESARLAINHHWNMNWNRWLGFFTSMTGLLAGGGVVWIVRATCTRIFGKEAIGFGDVTLMAMVGAFVGWQTAILAFFLAPLSAMVVGLAGYLFAGRGELPFGPHLALATVVCVFAWRGLWVEAAWLFSNLFIFTVMGVSLLIMLAVIAWMVQMVKKLIWRVRYA